MPSKCKKLTPRERLKAIACMLEESPIVRRQWDYSRVWSDDPSHVSIINNLKVCGFRGCAVGWARQLGIISNKDRLGDLHERNRKELGLTVEDMDEIFMGSSRLVYSSTCGLYNKPIENVTPDDVAKAIRRHLKKTTKK